MNIAEILREGARHAGDRTAIIDRLGAVSFAELDRQSARMAATFEAAGLRPGDRVLVVHPIEIRLYAVLIGLFRLGATALFLDPSAGRSYLDRCCQLAAPRGFVGVPRAHLLRLVSGGIRRIPIKLVIRDTTIRRDTPTRDRIEPCADDTPALLTFTSGSTGEPKAALRTHGFLLAQQRVLADSLRLRPGAIDMTTLPVFVLSNLASGVTSLLPDADLRRPGAIDPAPVLAQIARHRPASVIAAPAFLERLLASPSLTPTAFDSFEHIFTGGAPVFPRLLRALHLAAPQAMITAVYGSTEAEPIAEIDLSEIAEDDFAKMQAGAGLLAGRPVDAIALRILPDRWGTPVSDVTEATPPGTIGEIVVSGPHVLRGYLNGAGDSETKIRVGDTVWHRTGDAGYLDPRGRLWLLGRCSARVTDSRGTLYPFAVEAAAQSVDGVARAALIAHDGQRLLAIELDPRARIAPTTIESTLHTTLAWAALDGIIRLDTIPVDRRHNAKVDYVALRKLLQR
jgi:olefin beta-lactone synthetase